MTRVAYVDCFSGAAGDMLLGALVDAGLEAAALRDMLAKLPLSGYEIRVEGVVRQGISGTKLDVALHPHDHGHEHRHLSDIEALVERSALPPGVVSRALAVFRRLARAEAKVHGVPIGEVHFHEVGAVDSIVDVVGFVAGLELLGIEAVHSSPLTVGGGTVRTEHGMLPAPAPATLEILSEVGAPIRRHPRAETELLTPTAAALLAELAVFGPLEGNGQPAMSIASVGYGFGTKEFDWPNAVRVWLGEGTAPATSAEHDSVVLLECNLDDATGEMLGYTLERCLAAGALDVWFTPIQMKKNRPAVKLSVLTAPDLRSCLVRLLLRETPTLGVRYSLCQRTKAVRRIRTLDTPWGQVRVKEKILDGAVVAWSPEYEDCARLAREANVPLSRIYEAVEHGATTPLDRNDEPVS